MQENQEFNFYEMILVLKKKSRLFLLLFAVIFTAGALYTFLSPKEYQARSVFFFYNSGSSTGIGQGAELLSKVAGLNLNNNTLEKYAVSILKSRTISDNIISKFGPQFFGNKNQNLPKIKKYEIIEKKIEIKFNEDGLVEILATTKDPKLSAQMANFYIEEYKNFNDKSMFNQQKMESQYIEKQRNLTKEELNKIEKKMLVFQRKEKMVDIPTEAKDLLTFLTSLRLMLIKTEIEYNEQNTTLEATRRQLVRQAELSHENMKMPAMKDDPLLQTLFLDLTRKELELLINKENLTDSHPIIKNIQSEISSLKESIQKRISARLASIKSNLTDELIVMESSALAKKAMMEALNKTIEDKEKKLENLPGIELEYTRLYRDLKIKEAVYSYLEMELQRSKIKEIKNADNIQVLEIASPPDYPSFPRVILNLAIAALLGFMVAILSIFWISYIENQKKLYEDRKTLTNGV